VIRVNYRRLRSKINNLAGIVFVSVIDAPLSYYQPVLALGDFNSGKILEYMHKRSTCSEEEWKKAFHQLGISDNRYFSDKDLSKTLPWGHINYYSHTKLKKALNAIRSYGSNNNTTDPYNKKEEDNQKTCMGKTES
jgi:hypothetical protein